MNEIAKNFVGGEWVEGARVAEDINPSNTDDVVVGDAEGVIVIPAHLAEEIADEAVEMTAFEDFVTEEVLKGRSILGLYPATEERTRADFAAWRKAKGR